MKTVVILLGTVLLAQSVWARPEYAARNNILSCTACHVSPAGGGIRNTNGKLYGSHGYEPSPFAHESRFQGDVRSMIYFPEKAQASRNGWVLMSSAVTANLPVHEKKGRDTLNVVASYDMGRFNAGVREVYLRWQKTVGDWVEHITVGRFQPTVGLRTDEHRTYTRVQSATTHNNFYFGGRLSGRLLSRVHYDWSLVNGLQNPGEGAGNFSQGPTWGQIANVRWSPETYPFFTGLSGSFMNRHSDKNSPWAGSAYGALSLGPLTNYWMNGSFLVEGVWARYWNDTNLNPDMGRMFLPPAESSLADAVSNEASLGWYAQLNWDVTPAWSILYKFDSLTLANEFPADAFLRHGLGFRYFAGSNWSINARAELADAGRPDLSEQNMAAQNAYWLLFHFWL